MADIKQISEAISNAIPFTTSNYGESPDERLVYVPPAHIKALRLESNLVIGSRGVGKSFWTSALGTPSLRSLLGTSVVELESAQVRIGFAGTENIDWYPNAGTFANLLDDGFTPYEVWRSVVFRWLSEVTGDAIPIENWAATTKWVKDSSEESARLVKKANDTFQAKGQKGLIVFDALDRSSNDWRVMDEIVRDLLRVILWLKSYSAIPAKVFLREDQFARTVTDFPDASKLLATKSELTWQPHDLHGLLWQSLCNAPDQDGIVLRNIYSQVLGKPPAERNGIWILAEDAKREGPKQRALFEALAGPWMGKDRRRGVPYVWAVSHLADGKGRTSPRSFLAAIRAAAEESAEKYLDLAYPLHYESIKRGVQKASEIRIAEMAEDYPWVASVFEPLKGLIVPCDFYSIQERWNERVSNWTGTVTHDRLPPQHAERGWIGIKDDLERLGLFEVLKDGRINMPDLYRVGFGLGRRGGVKPLSVG